jgi:hypothetical protein
MARSKNDLEVAKMAKAWKSILSSLELPVDRISLKEFIELVENYGPPDQVLKNMLLHHKRNLKGKQVKEKRREEYQTSIYKW